MAPVISLGRSFVSGEQLTPTKLNELVDTATISGFTAGDFNLASVQFFTYGNTRPSLSRGAVHYDTTAGLEGIIFGFLSASAGSVSSWLYGTPRREVMCFTHTACSAYTPMFMGKPNNVSTQEYIVFDGCAFPQVWQYSTSSGPDAALFVTLESAAASKFVKCMWTGILPDAVLLSGAASRASVGSPLFVDYSDGGAFKAGAPTKRELVFGVNTLNGTSGAGAILWGFGPAIEDLTP
jgi:hypothetical protein